MSTSALAAEVPASVGTERLDALRHAMREAGLAAVVVVGDGHDGGGIRYFANHPIWSGLAYLVVPADGEPMLATPMRSQEYWARKRGWIADVRSSGAPIEQVVEHLASLDLKDGAAVGIAGLNELMPVRDLDRLKVSLAGLTLSDASPITHRIRWSKTSAELEALRESSSIADEGFERFTEVARAGRTEYEVIGEVERVVRSRGARHTLILMSQGPYLREPSGRAFQAGDFFMLSVELSGPSGYWVELGGMFSFGTPTAEDERLYACGKATFERAASLMRPGTRCSEVAEGLADSLASWGYEAGIWGGHGIGLDVGEQPRLLRSDQTVLQEGMTFGFHPHVIDGRTNHGVYLADTLCVTPEGGVGLSKLERTLRVMS